MDRILRKVVWFVIIFMALSIFGGSDLFWLVAVGLIVYIFVKRQNPDLWNKLKNNDVFKNFNFSNIKKSKNENMANTIDLNQKETIKKIKRTSWIVAIVILALWLLFSSIIVVDAGYTGVYSLFGRVKDKELSSGLHLVIPLAKVEKMSIRTEEYTMSITSDEGQKSGVDAISALTKEGLNVDLDITVLYSLIEDRASDVYETVGVNYVAKIIRPSIRSTIREVIAQYEAKDIYSEKRQEAAGQILANLKEIVEARGVAVEDVLLRNVKLPNGLAQSIQEKLQAEQESEKYDFILTKEEKERQRKVIEAEGQREAQDIISQSLTTNYLYYLYVKELKDREGTIYVPTNPSTGMPLFRNLGN